MDFLTKSRSERQMVARTRLRCGNVVTPTMSTGIRASDHMVFDWALQQISIVCFGFSCIANIIFKNSLSGN